MSRGKNLHSFYSSKITFLMERLLNTVDRNGEDAGIRSVEHAHRLPGIRHRAFSVVVVDSEGRHLLQKRSPEKKIFGEYWANACCSHDYIHYTDRDLLRRITQSCMDRLKYETGIDLHISSETMAGIFEYRTHLRDTARIVSAAVRGEASSLEELTKRYGLEPASEGEYGEWERDYVFLVRVEKSEMDRLVKMEFNRSEVSDLRAATIQEMKSLQKKAPWLLHIIDLFFHGKKESVVSL
jgi:isopentenyl-diphosphate delta-isomerase type 1